MTLARATNKTSMIKLADQETESLSLWAIVRKGRIIDFASGNTGKADLQVIHRGQLKRGNLVLMELVAMKWAASRDGWAAFGHAGPWHIRRHGDNETYKATLTLLESVKLVPNEGRFKHIAAAKQYADIYDDEYRKRFTGQEQLNKLLNPPPS